MFVDNESKLGEKLKVFAKEEVKRLEKRFQLDPWTRPLYPWTRGRISYENAHIVKKICRRKSSLKMRKDTNWTWYCGHPVRVRRELLSYVLEWWAKIAQSCCSTGKIQPISVTSFIIYQVKNRGIMEKKMRMMWEVHTAGFPGPQVVAHMCRAAF